MSFGPAFDAKEQVRQAVDIVDLVGSYVQLRRQGRNFVGLCPWHDDSRPSLQVNPERQSFKCWVCDIGGDVFSFVMKAEGLEFREALEMLAERAGIQLRSTDSHSSEPGGSPRRGPKTTSARCTASWPGPRSSFTAACSPRRKPNPAGSTWPSAASRPKAIRRFHLGFAPDRWDWLLERARGTRVDAANSRARRPAAPQGARRRLLRLVPRPRDVFDPRRPLAADRLRRPRAATASGRPLGQIHQLAGDAAVLQKPRAVRPRCGPRTLQSRTAARSSWKATPIA